MIYNTHGDVKLKDIINIKMLSSWKALTSFFAQIKVSISWIFNISNRQRKIHFLVKGILTKMLSETDHKNYFPDKNIFGGEFAFFSCNNSNKSTYNRRSVGVT